MVSTLKKGGKGERRRNVINKLKEILINGKANKKEEILLAVYEIGATRTRNSRMFVCLFVYSLYSSSHHARNVFEWRFASRLSFTFLCT